MAPHSRFVFTLLQDDTAPPRFRLAPIRISALVGAMLLSACGTNAPVSSLPPPAYRAAAATVNEGFRPGDTLELYVKEDPSFSSTYIVRAGGYILIPRVGRITVAGLGKGEAEQAIKRQLLNGQLTSATVLVERVPNANYGGSGDGSPRMMIYVTGKVSQPGQHFVPVPAGHSLGIFEALLMTGGVSKFAKESQVELLRSDSTGRRHKTLINVEKIRDGALPDVPLGEGDIINVPERVFGF